MDNLTHTLIGVIAGEACARSTRPSAHGLPETSRRNLLVAVCAIGSNLPDIDILWTLQGLGGDPLNYLVHHRGHTHTVLGCIGLLLLLQIGAMLWMRWRGLASTASDQIAVAAVGALGLGLHLGMDALNSYGIHPFWPFHNRWYYGDAVFIVEPLYWFAAIPLLFRLRTRLARGIVLLAALTGAGLIIWLHETEPSYIAIAIAAALLLAVIGRFATARVAALAGVLFATLLTLAFLYASHMAHWRVAAMAAAYFPAAATHDIVLTPAPTDARCWDFLLLQTQGRRYLARQGRLALGAPDALARCPAVQLGSRGTAPLTTVSQSHEAPAPEIGLSWTGEFAMQQELLVDIVTGDCRARQAMSFFRAPFAVRKGDEWILGDLRFDREAGAGFAEITVPSSTHPASCVVAPWRPPRADLLNTQGTD